MMAPNPSTYGIDEIKLKLLQNPAKYNELYSDLNIMMDGKKSWREKGILVFSYLIGIVLAVILYFNEKKLAAGIVVGVMLITPIPALIQLLFEKILPEISAPTTFRKDGWTWVRLTDRDKENYKRYILACDEYNHKTFTIGWDAITYKDGEAEVALKSRGQIIRYTCNSKLFYSSYISSLKNQFGQVEVGAKDGKYYIINPSVIEESILVIIKHLELLEKERLARIDALVNSNPEILNARKNQTTIIVSIKAQKSDYLNHLLNHQVPGISVIQTMECCSYATGTTDSYERAYIFATKNSRGKYCVIYENANEDNASIVATVDGEEKWYECAASMVNYMRSHKINKRESLRRTHDISGFAVKSINHDDIATWKSKVTDDYYVRKTTKHRYKKWRRW